MWATTNGIPETIVEMAINGAGVRDTSRVLGVSITTVIAHLKKIKARHR
jgi:transposase-like protein